MGLLRTAWTLLNFLMLKLGSVTLYLASLFMDLQSSTMASSGVFLPLAGLVTPASPWKEPLPGSQLILEYLEPMLTMMPKLSLWEFQCTPLLMLMYQTFRSTLMPQWILPTWILDFSSKSSISAILEILMWTSMVLAPLTGSMSLWKVQTQQC